MDCESPDFIYPMKADIYYAKISQNSYGQPQKQWIFDRTVICNASTVETAKFEQALPGALIEYEVKLASRTKSDIRVSSIKENYSLTNVLITNVRDAFDTLVYKETAGPRNNKGTMFVVTTFDPIMGPFKSVESYKMVWSRTESQAIGD